MTVQTRPRTQDRAGVRIDPRIRARRSAVSRSRGRRRLHRLVAAAVVVVVGALALTLLHSGLFEARHRVLRGTGHTPPAAVWRTAGITSATPLVDVSTGAAAARIERLPWIARAVVRLRWPDTVSVDVTERVPVAVVGTGPAAVVVDRTGRVLAPLTDVAGGGTLPRVVSAAGPVAPGHRVGPAARPGLAVAAALPPVLATRVTAVMATAGRVTLSLTGGVTAELGPATQVTAKFESLAAVLADPVSAPTGPAVVDVTDPGEPSVGPAAPG